LGVRDIDFSTYIPPVLIHAEASEILALLVQPYQLLASLMYGAGLRVVEAARLRVKDLDFDRHATATSVHNGAGDCMAKKTGNDGDPSRMGGVGRHSLGLTEHSAVCRSSQAKAPAAWQRTPGVWLGLPGPALTVLRCERQSGGRPGQVRALMKLRPQLRM
jgi:hypothetical protein